MSAASGSKKSVVCESKTTNLPCVCSVCGDGASEHLHYGAVCCFSCRAFFRRYADRDNCQCVRGDEKCLVDVARRNDCMKCRIKKCYEIGMRKDYVRGPNRALRRKREVEGFKGKKPNYKEEKRTTAEEKRGRPMASEKEMPEVVAPTSNSPPPGPPPALSPPAAFTSPAAILGLEEWARKQHERCAASTASTIRAEVDHEDGENGLATMSKLFPYRHHLPPPPPPPLSLAMENNIRDINDDDEEIEVDIIDPAANINDIQIVQPRAESKSVSVRRRCAAEFPKVFLEMCGGVDSNDDDEDDENEIERTDTAAASFCYPLSSEVVDEIQSCRVALSTIRSGGAAPTITFTVEEFNLMNFIRKKKCNVVSKITNGYFDEQYRQELTSVLMSKGAVKPSFQFVEKLNQSISQAGLELMNEILDLFDLPIRARKFLLSENTSYASLVGAAVFAHGNDAKTFAEQARVTGTRTMYVQWLEENGLEQVVPRMESEYFNPSPWAEKETYEHEFNNIMKEIGTHVGTDQFLSCLLIMANLFSLPDNVRTYLSGPEEAAVIKSRKQVLVLLNRFLRVKYGPKKASSKTHHHFYLMHMLKRVARIYMEKKLVLTRADNFSDIKLWSDVMKMTPQSHHMFSSKPAQHHYL